MAAKRGSFLVSHKFCSSLEATMCSAEALAMWVRAGSWSACYQTGGVIERHMLSSFTQSDTDATAIADELVKRKLWRRIRGGYLMLPGLGKVIAADFRPAIPQSIRRAVMERDGFQCVECESTEDLSLDHIRPYSLGGADTIANLRVLCRICNSRKGARINQAALDQGGQ